MSRATVVHVNTVKLAEDSYTRMMQEKYLACVVLRMRQIKPFSSNDPLSLLKRKLHFSSVLRQIKKKDEFPYKVGFIGAGNMAKAIGFSSLDSGLLTPSQMIVSDPTPSQFEPWKARKVATTDENVEVVSFADIILIAAPPQHFDHVISSLQDPRLSTDHQKCFVSTLVGKTVRALEEALNSVTGLKVNPQVIRVTPNTPAMVGAGCSIMVCDETASYTKPVLQLLKASGSCEIISEEWMNACSATSGSGPAYIYLVFRIE
ncbi:pyrroline-5-carboxylate reductase [Nesidiocoris tenuis]|uniref:Pyrroline-5-carboxylate reductase n=1 Tax=Nesidiocoris tenuis TaxID=355587 RepID=A0ABN7ANV0_9HEMI|nr:pyrroline-5-carboxylate reductase [Nesidiocoris tenuis]